MSTGMLIIIMGSKSDEGHARKIIAAAHTLGVETQLFIGSAHKTPAHVLSILARCEADPRPKVYVTIAGLSNALSGFVDGSVSAPVIACPPPNDAFGGADVFSSLRMPPGIAPAAVLDPSNAALMAAKILGLQDPFVHEKVIAFQQAQSAKVISDNESIK